VAEREPVSEPTAAAARPPGKPPGKTYAGLSRNQWFIVGGVFVAVLAYLWWRNRQAAQAAAAGQTPTSAGSNECTDANGNPVDCGELTAQELATLQNQLDQLQQQGIGGGGSAGGVTGNGSTTDGSTGTTTTTTNAPGTPTSAGGATATRTAAKTAGPVTGLSASALTKTSFKATWQAATGATGGYAYIVRDLATHTQVTAGMTRATSVTVSGLKAGTDYNFGIQALPGGGGANVHVRTKP
jgi:hypothetical protein